MAVLNGTFFIRVNTRLLSYRRNENVEEDGYEGKEESEGGGGEARGSGKGEPTGQCISG